MTIYSRDARGRFAARPKGTPSRKGIGGRRAPGALPFENQRQASGWVMWAFTDTALTKRQARTIWLSRGGSKRYFEQVWTQQRRIPRHVEARLQSLRAQRAEANRAKVPLDVWRSRHYRGTKLYWLGASREEYLHEFYPEERSKASKGA